MSAIRRVAAVVVQTLAVVAASPAMGLGDDATGRSFSRGAIIPIRGTISDVTIQSLERRIDRAIEQGADLLIFEMDTPGGVVSSALEICDRIKNLQNVHTVAWIHNDAFSAGAMISLACREIVVSRRSKLGDCQPIMMGPQGVSAVPEDVAAKLTSPLLEEFRDSARRNGYNVLLCEAMIQPEIEVFWVQNKRTGEQRFVSRQERDELFGIGQTTAPSVSKKTEVIETARGPGGATKKLQTQVERRPGQHVSDSQSRTDWRYVKQHPLLGPVKQPVVAANELLTMSQNQAMAFGFARYQLGDQTALARHFGLDGRLVRLEYTWSEKLVEWLTSPMVRAVLLVVLLLAGYIELNTPGVGLPGIVALVCLAIFLGAPYMTGLADAWDILLVVAGVVLLGLEIFVIPGFGVAGIAGIAMICIGVVASFVGPEFPNQPPVHWPTLDYTVQGLKTGIWVLAGGLTTALAGGIVLSRILPKVPYVGQIVPPNPVAASLAMEDPYPPEIALPGDIGTSEGPLRPAGKARFNGVLVDVLTEGEFIEPGRQVKVIERRGNRIVVRPVRTQEHG